MEKAPINWTNMVLFTATPFFAATLVPTYGYFFGFDLFEWAAFLAMMAFCGISITAGYHRLWSHKTYEAHPAVQVFFALGGACALQNDILHWASDHRRHHQFVDNNERDPYSAGRGFWFSHMGWILRNYKSGRRDFSNIKDLQRNSIVMWQHKHYLKLVLAMNIGVPAMIGILHGDLIASLLLAGLLRLVLSQHVTWLINSIAHMWGRQPYSRDCTARDNPLLALITWGEGYHNYHHTFQWDYRNGVRWWQFDPTKWLIRGLSVIGLTHSLKRCPPARIEQARLKLQFETAALKCEQLNLSDSLRQRLEQEYEQLQQTLQQWAELRQAWTEARSQELKETLEHWDRLQLRDRYRELQFRLKTQRRRWNQLLINLAEPLAQTA